MDRTPQIKNVLIVLWLAGSGGRKQLSGILRYVNENHPWNICIVSDPRDFTATMQKQSQDVQLDGFLGHANSEAAQTVTAKGLPCVLLDYPPPSLGSRKGRYLLMLDADEEIGRRGSDYFHSLGKFASFGFVPDTENRAWSRLRERGFRKAIAARGERARTYDERRETLGQWIVSLPKPAAVMAANDFRAQIILDACRANMISVPDDVSVLGVNNDEIICEYSSPSITSIRIDHERLGYMAARELDRMMTLKSPMKATRRMLIPDTGIVERSSTRHTVPAVILVDRISRWIEEHATESITTKDIVAYAGVSRSLADLRFRQLKGKSIRRALEDRRLELVCRHLGSGNMPIMRVSRLCGFHNVQRLKYVFKARFGMSMSEYRRQNGTLHKCDTVSTLSNQ